MACDDDRSDVDRRIEMLTAHVENLIERVADLEADL
jgi:hypothetical protein